MTEQQALLQRQHQELRATIQSMENLLAESRGQASTQAARAAELEQDNRTVSSIPASTSVYLSLNAHNFVSLQLTAQVETLHRTIDQLTAKANKAEEILNRNRESIVEYERKLQQSLAEIDRHTQNQSNLSSSVSEREHEVRQLKSENDNLAKTLQETREEIQHHKDTIRNLKERIAELENSERSSRRLVSDARREAAESIRLSEDTHHRRYEERSSQDRRSRDVEGKRTRDVDPDAYHYKSFETPRR